MTRVIGNKTRFVVIIAILFMLVAIFFANSNGLIVDAQSYLNEDNLITRSNFDEFLSRCGKNRTAFTSGEEKTSKYLAEEMLEVGLEYYFGDSYIDKFRNGQDYSQNVVGVKKSKTGDKYVVLGAHYDNVYNFYDDSKSNGSNGVYDNASGVICLLTIMRQLQYVDMPYHIIYVFYGAEEYGMLGSKYFLSHFSGMDKKQLLFAFNFDSIGVGEYNYFYTDLSANSYKSLFENNEFNVVSTPAYFKPSYLSSVDNYAVINTGMMSDNKTFLENGIKSVTFFSGDFSTTSAGFLESKNQENIYHTPNDNLINILEVYPNFIDNCNSVVSLTLSVMQNAKFVETVENSYKETNWNFLNNKYLIVAIGLVGLIFCNAILTRKFKKINSF